MTRSISAVLALLSLSLAGGALARGRAVRSAAPQCAYSLSPGFSAPVTPAGLSQAAITVNPTSCTGWNAYSLTSWVTVSKNGSVAYLDVAPNPTSTPRTATLLIAGIRYDLTQDGSPVISPPVDESNVLKNPGFDTDLSFWGWFDRFPNGAGSALWSSFDAGNNAASGSIRLINTASGHTFQQLQCVTVDAGEVYQYGGKFFATSTGAGSAMWTIYEYKVVSDCSDDRLAVGVETKTPRIRTPGTWQLESYTKRMGPETTSALMVIGSRSTSAGAFEVFMDDLFLRKP